MKDYPLFWAWTIHQSKQHGSDRELKAVAMVAKKKKKKIQIWVSIFSEAAQN